MAKPQEKVSFRERLKQIGQVFAFTARQDKWFVPLIIAAVLIPLAVTVLLVLLDLGWVWIPIGIMVTLLAALIVLNLRSNTAMMNVAEGQPGAAAQIMENMRGDWRVRPAASSTTQFDMVHVVIGRPGVILVGEGTPSKLRSMMSQEKRRLAKIIGTTELREFVIGNDEGQVPLKKLRASMLKLPRVMQGSQITATNDRLRAMGDLMSNMPLPKGPMPKGMRMPRGGKMR